MAKFVLLFILIFSCCSEEEQEGIEYRYSIPSEYAIVQQDKAPEFWVEMQYLFWGDSNSTKTRNYWTPTISDIEVAEKATLKYLNSELKNNSNEEYFKEKLTYISEHFKLYKRQYLGLIINNEKLIWCNYLLLEEKEDLTSPIIVLDGGAEFWRLIYNVEKKQCTRFDMNGEA